VYKQRARRLARRRALIGFRSERHMQRSTRRPTGRKPARKPARPVRKTARTVRTKKPASTALVKAPPKTLADTAIEDAPGQLPIARTVTDGITIGELGLQEPKLTKREREALSKPVPEDKIRILPTGYPYIPHGYVIELFNRALGLGAWALTPVSRPSKIAVGRAELVSRGYVLHIHRVPVAFAEGEQLYYPGNAEQTYGDALEGTRGSALKRAAKHLGIGVELMDPGVWRAWRARHAVQVMVEKRVKNGDKWESKDTRQWRLKTDDPLPGEKGGRGSAPAKDRPVAAHPDDERPITEAQVTRLHAIASNVRRPATEIKMWLKVRYGIDSSREIKRSEYEYVVKCIEGTGPLPLPVDSVDTDDRVRVGEVVE
jgi:hypothetical protein